MRCAALGAVPGSACYLIVAFKAVLGFKLMRKGRSGWLQDDKCGAFPSETG